MAEEHFRVSVEGDHIRKLANAQPIQAVAELIWNSVDADATQVDLEVEADTIMMRSIVVKDNGHGIARNDAGALFSKLGGSWKGHGSRSKTKNRMLHGKEGRGRFKALALGRVADWTVRYPRDGKLFEYTVTIVRDDMVDVRVSEEKEVPVSRGPGVEVRVSELDREYRSLNTEAATQSLSEIFAIYLTDYSEVEISVGGELLDPTAHIALRKKIDQNPIRVGTEVYPVELEVIEWTSATERAVFLCGEEGFPLQRVTPTFHSPGHQFSAYLKSPYISKLQNEGMIGLVELNGPLKFAYDMASESIKALFQQVDTEAAQTQIERWKAEKVYPYRSEPTTSVEQAERQVFDIMALSVNKHLGDFAEQSTRAQAFQLRMLRQAIERGPEELQHILTEVLDLPERAQKELSRLLQESSLANVISASKLVADRLKFIHGLEALLFDPDSKALLKERSQLHRMIAENNTWIFGEQFNLTVDDEGLTSVLAKHRKLIGADTVIDKPVKRIDGKVGIVDLMISRSVPQNRADEFEHLVVELKRPSVKIGAEELVQIEKYAYTIADDERFRHQKTRWSFWVISNDLDSFAMKRTREKEKPRGRIYQSEDGMIEIWVKVWSEIIGECKSRLQFVQQHLKANVEKENALKYLKATYEKYLTGIEMPGDEDAEEAEAETVDAIE